MTTIGIIGCGWLGLPLAKALIKEEFTVYGSTTSDSTYTTLTESNIHPCKLLIDDKHRITCSDPDIFSSDIIIITLPFKRSFSEPQDYVLQLKALLSTIEERNRCHSVLFTSSTSIYPLNNGIVTEDTPIEPKNPRQQALLDVEQYLLSLSSIDTCILRCGGMYGNDRHIGNFLSGKKVKGNGQEPVNLIHLYDLIGIITLIVKRPIKNSIYNLVSTDHPSKSDLYHFHCIKNGISPPTFTDTSCASFKIVSNHKILQSYSYSLKYPTPLAVYS